MKSKAFLICTVAQLAIAGAAQAQINSRITTPVRSSTINGGAAGDVVITGNGSIDIEDTNNVSAVTLDTNHAVISHGLISLEDSNDAVGIRINGGVAGRLEIIGDIELLETYTRPDANGDGEAEGAYAIGARRTGILLSGPGGFTGDILLGPTASIAIEGNQSAGIRLESRLNGAFVSDAAVSVLGDGATGIEFLNGASGVIRQSGNVSAVGLGARGVVVIGDVGGAFINEASVIATGFINTNTTAFDEPANLLAGGPAVSIGGSLTHGFLNNGLVGGDQANDTTKDTIEDFDENRSTGVIRSFGSGPALLISANLDPAATGNLVFGEVVETVRDTLDDDDDDNTAEIIATFAMDHGFINRGTIAANGLNNGFAANAAIVEGKDAARRTIIEGGFLNAGTISAAASRANASALSIGNYTTTPALLNGGRIEAQTVTESDHAARALVIEAQADVQTIFNAGTILAAARGADGAAYAVVDRSGTVSSLTNQGVIEARLIEHSGDGPARAVAIDLSAHAGGGLAVLQNENANAAIIGDVLLSAAADSFRIETGSMVGGAILGGGDDEFVLDDAGFFGAIDLGGGVDRIEILNGAQFSGSIVDADGDGALAISDSDVQFLSSSPLALAALNVSGESVLRFATGLGAPDVAFISADSAVLASDTDISVAVTEFRRGERTFLLIESPNLEITGGGMIDATVAAPAIYKGAVDISDTSISVSLVEKTSAELGLNINESRAFGAFLSLAEADDAVGAALTSYVDEDALVSAYGQLVPDFSDAATRFLSGEASIVTGSVGRRFDHIASEEEGSNGFWMMEQTSYIREDADSEVTGYDGFSISFDAGYDRRVAEHVVVGASGAVRIGKHKTPDEISGEYGATAYHFNGYAASRIGRIKLDAAAGVGLARLNSKRVTNFGGLQETYEGGTDAFFTTASARVSYRAQAGRFFLEPMLAFDYFRMKRDAYTEFAADPDAPLALSIGEAITSRSSATGLLRVGRGPAEDLADEFAVSFFYEGYAGYRAGIGETLYEVEASFAARDESFLISDLVGYDNAAVGGLAIGARGAGYSISLNYDGEFEGAAMSHRFGGVLRLSF